MSRRAWQATSHEEVKSQTWLSDWTHMHELGVGAEWKQRWNKMGSVMITVEAGEGVHDGLLFLYCSLYNWLSLKWKVSIIKNHRRTSLMLQWLGILLPVKGIQVQFLVWEDPTGQGATKPMCCNYWACVPQNPGSTTKEANAREAQALNKRVAPTHQRRFVQQLTRTQCSQENPKTNKPQPPPPAKKRKTRKGREVKEGRRKRGRKGDYSLVY